MYKKSYSLNYVTNKLKMFFLQQLKTNKKFNDDALLVKNAQLLCK